MKLSKLITGVLLSASLVTGAWALDLNGAMNALSDAKTSGLVGEQPNGYLGVVKSTGDAQQITKLINDARKAEYQRVAKNNGITLADVEAMAGVKAIEKTPSGQYIQVNGKWVTK